MENIDIRKYIIENFKDDNEEKIKDSIETTIKFRDEDALIGLGVLFELLWNNMTEEEKKDNLTKIRTGIKNLANQSQLFFYNIKEKSYNNFSLSST